MILGLLPFVDSDCGRLRGNLYCSLPIFYASQRRVATPIPKLGRRTPSLGVADRLTMTVKGRKSTLVYARPFRWGHVRTPNHGVGHEQGSSEQVALEQGKAGRPKGSDFANKGWEAGGQATMAAKSSAGGKAIAGAVSVSPGVWVYQNTDKGLAAELSVKGTKYYKDKSLN